MAEIKLSVQFENGDRVKYSNKLKDEGIVTCISIRGKGGNQRISYGVTWSAKDEHYHDDFEIELSNPK